MKSEHEAVLLEAHRRMKRHARTPRPSQWQPWDRQDYDDETAHGPAYAASEWFGELLEHERQRYRRAIDDLRRAGLLTTWAKWGRRLSNIRLTPAGEKAAREAAAAQRKADEKPKRARAPKAEQTHPGRDVGEVPTIATAADES